MNKEIHKTIREKLLRLSQEHGTLEYEIIEHKVIEKYNRISYWDIQSIDINELDLMTKKIMINQIRDNVPFLVTSSNTYNIITALTYVKIERDRQFDLKSKIESSIFDKSMVWIKIKDIEKYSVNALNKYFTMPEIKYCLTNNIPLIDTNFEIGNNRYNNKLTVNQVSDEFDYIFDITESTAIITGYNN